MRGELLKPAVDPGGNLFYFFRNDSLNAKSVFEKEDLFAHYSAILMDGYKTLKAGQTVSFSMIQGPKGVHAVAITPVAQDNADATPDLRPGAVVQFHVPRFHKDRAERLERALLVPSRSDASAHAATFVEEHDASGTLPCKLVGTTHSDNAAANDQHVDFGDSGFHKVSFLGGADQPRETRSRYWKLSARQNRCS